MVGNSTERTALISVSCGGTYTVGYSLIKLSHPVIPISAGGLGEIYAYLPLTEVNAHVLMDVPPKTIENPDYGFSVGRGAWTFQAGAWNTVAERIKLNKPGKNDGIFQSFYDIFDFLKLSLSRCFTGVGKWDNGHRC